MVDRFLEQLIMEDILAKERLRLYQELGLILVTQSLVLILKPEQMLCHIQVNLLEVV